MKFLFLGDGDCDNDAQCGEGLICGRNNFLTFHPDVAGAKTKDDACVETGMYSTKFLYGPKTTSKIKNKLRTKYIYAGIS